MGLGFKFGTEYTTTALVGSFDLHGNPVHPLVAVVGFPVQ